MGLSLLILYYKDLTVTLFEVETLNHIIVVGSILYIWLAYATSSCLHSLRRVCGVPLTYIVLASADTTLTCFEILVPAIVT